MDELKKIYSELPQSLQTIISSQQWRGKVEEIADRYKIDETKKNDLSLEVLYVMIGLKDLNELHTNIETELGVPKDESVKIADAITQKVLNPIEEYVKKKEGAVEHVPEPVKKSDENLDNPIPKKEASKEESYEPDPEESSERLDRLQILSDIENPVTKKPKHPETGMPVAPAPEQSAKLARPEQPKPKPVETKPVPQQFESKSEPKPTPEPVPEPRQDFSSKNLGGQAQKPDPAVNIEKKDRPSDGGDLLSTIQQAQEKHGANIVDQKLGNVQTSKPAPEPQKTAPSRTNDPYREPIE